MYYNKNYEEKMISMIEFKLFSTLENKVVEKYTFSIYYLRDCSIDICQIGFEIYLQCAQEKLRNHASRIN